MALDARMLAAVSVGDCSMGNLISTQIQVPTCFIPNMRRWIDFQKEHSVMTDASPQSLAHHSRYDPLFHFFVLPVFAITLLISMVNLVRRPGLHSTWLVVFMIAALFVVFKVRLYPLKVQDRVIRLEERLRLMTLLDPGLRPRIAELTESQLVALRFASDAELPALAMRALNEKLAAPDIKKAIQQWRPDYWRV
jgi:uncharacterized protein DUF6526